jgi:hypothetical protein
MYTLSSFKTKKLHKFNTRISVNMMGKVCPSLTAKTMSAIIKLKTIKLFISIDRVSSKSRL